MYIRQLSVTNYRSLRNVQIGSMSPFTVFYGHNDSGKSNILSFLELLFRKKSPEDSTLEINEGDETPPSRPGVFWRGLIEDFGDNFFRNKNEPIEFSVLIRYKRSEIKGLSSLAKSFLDELPSRQLQDHLRLNGQIIPVAGDFAKIVLLSADFDSKTFFELDRDETPKYLPGFPIPEEDKLGVFDLIMARLNNGFLTIPASRYLSDETEEFKETRMPLTSATFKNWMLQTGLDRRMEEIYKSIGDQFNSSPFQHGRITLARTGGKSIEIFVEDEAGLKLPIGRKGSGVQQTLMILAYVAQSNSPLVGIEELEVNLSPPSQKSLFDDLKKLIESNTGPISQIFLTTHSHHLARRNDVQRRGVWIRNGETQVKRPSEAEMDEFFR